MGISSSRSEDTGGGDHQSGGKLLIRPAKGRMENKLRGYGGYLSLYKAVVKDEWNEARKFLDEDPEAAIAKITIASETALHIAVGHSKIDFVDKLIRRMSPEDLAVIDQNGETALTAAAIVGNIEAAKLLVNKNPDLLNIYGKSGFAIHRAAQFGKRKMVNYLYEVTGTDIDPSPFTGQHGAELLIATITADFFDIALKLVKRHPEMATVELSGQRSALATLATKTGAFPSGSNTNNFGFSKRRVDRKVMQEQALKLVKSLCMEICELDDASTFYLLQKPLHQAAKLGIPEIIKVIVDLCPPVIWSTDKDDRNVFQLAVLHRQERIFSLIHGMTNYKLLAARYTDQNGNNILHLAGQLPTPDRLNLVSGAALQVQRELKWFQKVESLVPTSWKETQNKEGKTPTVVFKEAHRQLMKDGKKWMETTATSCTVAATLIAGVVFGAAMRVPGGNDTNSGGNGTIFDHKAFSVFAVADGISLFSSVATILIFLSILTSRYTEVDFLHTLPNSLVIGLVMLFISMLSMMVAFGAAMFLVFGPMKAKILSWVGGSTVFLVTIFALSPLLHQALKSKRKLFRK